MLSEVVVQLAKGADHCHGLLAHLALTGKDRHDCGEGPWIEIGRHLAEDQLGVGDTGLEHSLHIRTRLVLRSQHSLHLLGVPIGESPFKDERFQEVPHRTQERISIVPLLKLLLLRGEVKSDGLEMAHPVLFKCTLQSCLRG